MSNSTGIDISVIVPVYNVEQYLEQCLDSLVNQSFEGSVEFICVNDGSTDGSLDILRKYEEQDNRFIVIDKKNEGNGKTMNVGLNASSGKYIAILESDDWAQESMLSILFDAAENSNAEVVKGNYNQIVGNTVTPRDLYPRERCGFIFSATDYPEFLYDSMAIWTGLYRRDFLFSNNITFNETPGASYQDTSFTFLVWLYAKKMYLVTGYLVNYRMDNANSSVNSTGKAYCLCDEFERIEDRLNRDASSLRIWKIETKMKYVKYDWNHGRLSNKYKDDFYRKMLSDLFEADKRGHIEKSLYTEDEYSRLEAALWSFARREWDIVDKSESSKIIRQLPQAILSWYEFKKGSNVLLIGASNSLIVDLLEERRVNVHVSGVRLVINNSDDTQYDYIISIGQAIEANDIMDFIQDISGKLSDRGILLLGIDNPLGLRFICGDDRPNANIPDAYLIEKALRENGLPLWNRFSVFSRLEEATHVIRDGYISGEDLANRIIPSYQHAEGICENEAQLYEAYQRNGILHQAANAYLFEASKSGNVSDVLQITSTLERGSEKSILTVIHENGRVEKFAAFSNGIEHINEMLEYQKDLMEHNVEILPMNLTDNKHLIMDYIDAPTGAKVIQDTLNSGDVDNFVSLMDRFRDIILSSSEKNHIDGQGTILRHGYYDMIPLNSFYMDGKFIIFDQEYCIDDYPAEVIICRLIESIYSGHPELQDKYPSEKIYERYGLLGQRERLKRIVARELAVIRMEAELKDYHRKTRAPLSVVSENKERNKFGVAEHNRLFDSIFENVLDKSVYIFGSGTYAKKFLERYKKIIDIKGIMDNASEKWGSYIDEIPIISPEVLEDETVIKIIICVKQFESILQQLKDRGIYDVSIFNPNRTYRLPQKVLKRADNAYLKETESKFNVGYIAGVFDMFHMGHLNVIRRAKAHCNHLIVGVCSDEWVRGTKKTEPIMDFEERIELVRSCKYVDEAVRIPPEAPTTWDAYRMYHFDVQFSGSDYENDPGWLMAKDFLEENGSTLVFFPYTETTSSTKLKEMIHRRLI